MVLTRRQKKIQEDNDNNNDNDNDNDTNENAKDEGTNNKETKTTIFVFLLVFGSVLVGLALMIGMHYVVEGICNNRTHNYESMITLDYVFTNDKQFIRHVNISVNFTITKNYCLAEFPQLSISLFDKHVRDLFKQFTMDEINSHFTKHQINPVYSYQLKKQFPARFIGLSNTCENYSGKIGVCINSFTFL